MGHRLALGTVQFGLDYGIANTSGQVDLAAVAELLALARRNGVDTLDTAFAYGISEQVLGAVGVEDWNVVTKLPALPDACPDVAGWVQTQMQMSLERLGVSQVYSVLLHRPAQLLGAQGKELLTALEHLQLSGQTQKIGISVYGPEELEALFALKTFDLVQAPLNILDRRLLVSGWAARLKLAGVELHTRSAFLQGLLLLPHFQRPEKFSRWNALWSEWQQWLEATGQTPLEACLRYVFSISDVDKVVVGVDSSNQLKQILAAANDSLPGFPPDWSSPVATELLNPALWNTL